MASLLVVTCISGWRQWPLRLPGDATMVIWRLFRETERTSAIGKGPLARYDHATLPKPGPGATSIDHGSTVAAACGLVVLAQAGLALIILHMVPHREWL